MKRPPRVTVRLPVNGVRRDVLAEVRRVIVGLARVSPHKHDITISVVPHGALIVNGVGNGFGACIVPPKGSRRVRIAIAGGLYRVARRDGEYPHAEALRLVGHTVAHEWAHYEQFRDGRRMQERGVNVRAASLLRQIAA